MKITDIKVFPVREDKLKAFVSIILDDCFMVNDIKVIKGQDGFFISMPSRRKRNGKFKDIAHPLNNETRQSMEQEILAAYQEHLVHSPEDAIAIEPRSSADAGPSRRRRRSRGRRRRGSATARGAAASTSDGSPEASETRGDARPKTASQPRAAERPQEARSEGGAEPAPEPPAKPGAERAGGVSGENRDRGKPPEPPAREVTDVSDKSAEEVAEHHLSDSFWET